MQRETNEQRAVNLFHAWQDGNLTVRRLQGMADCAAGEGMVDELAACELALKTIAAYSKGM